MRRWLVSAILLLGGLTAWGQNGQPLVIPPQEASRLLGQLLERKQYFELERALQGPLELSGLYRAFYEGVLANRRNRIALSIERLQPLVAALAARNKDYAVVALSTLADDYEKSYQYSAAADTYAELERNYKAYMSPAEQLRVKQEAERWKLLRGAPPLTTQVAAPFIVPTRRDAMGLTEVQVQLGRRPQWMIIDTGANICTLSSSAARELGLKLSAGTATTKGIIGETISIHTAVIPQLRLGRATVRNVPVIVIPDQAMYVRRLRFKIPPSLGFPVLAALGRVTFFADGRFGVRLRQPSSPILPRRNLFLEKLTPLVAANVGDGEQLFTFDTGSSGIFLSAQFYRRHAEAFEGRRLTQFRLAGAGGTRQYPAYYLARLRLRLGGGCTVTRDVPVLAAPQGVSDDHFWGNLGQSAVHAFRSYTLDFRGMSFEVDPPTSPFSARCPAVAP
jgi:hypothetical protein